MTDPSADQRNSAQSRASILARSLERQRVIAWERAHYQREQEDQLTSRIRFGLVVLNSASVVTLLNLDQNKLGISGQDIAICAAFFLVGAIASGYSLFSHQNHQVVRTGMLQARAVGLDIAASLVEFPSNSPEWDRLKERLDEIAELDKESVKPNYLAISLQNIGSGTWLGGAIYLALHRFAALYPTLQRQIGSFTERFWWVFLALLVAMLVGAWLYENRKARRTKSPEAVAAKVSP